MTTLVEGTPSRFATEARISFRQPVNRTGSIDGAWWPRSSDLAAELPALLEVFWTAGRDMARIAYHLDSWDPAPRKMQVAGKVVRAGGYHYGNPLVVTLSDAWQTDSADLLVIPFDTNPPVAERVLALAAVAGSLLTAQQLLERAAG